MTTVVTKAAMMEADMKADMNPATRATDTRATATKEADMEADTKEAMRAATDMKEAAMEAWAVKEEAKVTKDTATKDTDTKVGAILVMLTGMVIVMVMMVTAVMSMDNRMGAAAVVIMGTILTGVMGNIMGILVNTTNQESPPPR